MQDKLTHQYFNWLPFSPCTYMGCVYAGCMSDNYCVCVCVNPFPLSSEWICRLSRDRAQSDPRLSWPLWASSLKQVSSCAGACSHQLLTN